MRTSIFFPDSKKKFLKKIFELYTVELEVKKMRFTEEEKDLLIETLEYRLEEDSEVVRRGETLREDLQELIRRFEEE